MLPKFVVTETSLDRDRKEANAFWDKQYKRFLETKDPSFLVAAMQQCNLNDQVWLNWAHREQAIKLLQESEQMTDQEFNHVEGLRKLLLQILKEIKGK